MEIFWLVLASILAIIGLIGAVIPILPGAPLNFAAILILHFVRGGEVFGTAFLVILGVLTALSIALDYVLPIISAKVGGASKYGLIGAVVGMVTGFVVFSFIGMIAGMLLGAVAGELKAGKKKGEAWRAGFTAFAGSLSAVVMKFGLSAVMTAVFFVNLFGG